jgi:hypothetical protein
MCSVSVMLRFLYVLLRLSCVVLALLGIGYDRNVHL